MKCIAKDLKVEGIDPSPLGLVIRVDDSTASFLVDKMGWRYVPKKTKVSLAQKSKREPTWLQDLSITAQVIISETSLYQAMQRNKGLEVES